MAIIIRVTHASSRHTSGWVIHTCEPQQHAKQGSFMAVVVRVTHISSWHTSGWVRSHLRTSATRWIKRESWHLLSESCQKHIRHGTHLNESCHACQPQECARAGGRSDQRGSFWSQSAGKWPFFFLKKIPKSQLYGHFISYIWN